MARITNAGTGIKRTVPAPREAEVAPPPIGRPPAAAGGDRLVRTSLVARIHPGTPTQPTMAGAVRRLAEIEADLVKRGDNRAVFATTYLMQTRATAELLAKPGSFEDQAYMTRLALRFVQYYLDAYDAYEQGDRAKVPEPWRRAFDLATQKKTLVIEDLALGINAHINHDLPRALAVTGARPGAHARDFDKYNALLFANIDDVKQAVVERYTTKTLNVKILDVADRAGARMDDALTERLFKLARSNAWVNGQALISGKPDAVDEIQQESMALVKAIELGIRLNPLHDDWARAKSF